MAQILLVLFFLFFYTSGESVDLKWDDAWNDDKWTDNDTSDNKEQKVFKEKGSNSSNESSKDKKIINIEKIPSTEYTTIPDSKIKSSQINKNEKEKIWELDRAISNNDLEKVIILLEKDVDPNTILTFCPILSEAAKKGNAQIVDALLKAGANPNLNPENCNLIPLTAAAVNGKHDVILKLLEAGADINRINYRDETALHRVVCEDFVCEKTTRKEKDILKTILFLKEKGIKINLKRKDGLTPLHLAVKKGYLETSKSLLNLGANIDQSSKEGMTPFHIAVKENKIEIADLLIKHGADFQARSKEGLVPLSYAFKNGQIKMVDLLINNGAILSSAFPTIHEISAKGYTKLLKILIDGGINVDLPDKDKRTALHFAAANNKLQAVKILFKNGALLNSTDYLKNTPLHYGGIHLNILNFLLENGAEINIKNSEGMTPLHFSAPIIDEQCLKKFIDAGVNLDEIDSSGRTALHIASDYGSIEEIFSITPFVIDGDHTKIDSLEKYKYSGESVRILLKHGSNPNFIDKNGVTPLIGACGSRNILAAKELIANGAQINDIDNTGYSPLLLLFFNEDLGNEEKDFISNLIKSGANVNVSTIDGLTPLDIALAIKENEIATLLKKYGAKEGEGVINSKEKGFQLGEDKKGEYELNSDMWINNNIEGIEWINNEDQERDVIYTLCEEDDFISIPNNRNQLGIDSRGYLA